MKKLISIAVILAMIFTLAIPAFAAAGNASPSNATEMWVNCANGKTLNLRKEPASGSKVLKRLECGTKLEILEFLNNGWAYVTDGRNTGYVMVKFLVDTKPGKYEITEREDDFAAVTPYMVSAIALNNRSDRSVGLRVRPNKTAQMIRRLEAGDELQVVARGRLWSRVVDMQTGKTGYVANDYIQRI